MDYRVIKSKTSNVSDEDILVIEKLIHTYKLTSLLFCDYINLEKGTISEDNVGKVIKIDKKIFGTGAPDITIEIGNYVE